jgi:putative transposase
MRVLRPTTWAGRLDKIMATRKRHSSEQVVRKLMAADRLLAEGKDTAAVCRELGRGRTPPASRTSVNPVA